MTVAPDLTMDVLAWPPTLDMNEGPSGANRKANRPIAEAPPRRYGKIPPATPTWPRGRAMPPLEPIWVVFVTMVLVGCVVLAMRAFRRRRR
jgi:hypothetical protein